MILLINESKDASNSKTNKFLFEKGYDFQELNNLDDALQEFKKNNFKIGLFDFLSSDNRGLDFFEKLNILFPGNYTQFIILNEKNSSDYKKNYFQKGILDFYNKPINYYSGLENSLKEGFRIFEKISEKEEFIIEKKKQLTKINNSFELLNIFEDDTKIDSNFMSYDGFRIFLLASEFINLLELKISDKFFIKVSSFLSETNKIIYPDDILLKHRDLYPAEFGLIKRQMIINMEMIKKHFNYNIAKNIYYQYENYDGNNNFCNIKGRDIPLGARILKIINDYENIKTNNIFASKNIKLEIVMKQMFNRANNYDLLLLKVFFENINTIETNIFKKVIKQRKICS